MSYFICMRWKHVAFPMLVPIEAGEKFVASIPVGGVSTTDHEATALNAARAVKYAKGKGIFQSGVATATETHARPTAIDDGASQFSTVLNSVLVAVADLKASNAQLEGTVCEEKEDREKRFANMMSEIAS